MLEPPEGAGAQAVRHLALHKPDVKAVIHPKGPVVEDDVRVSHGVLHAEGGVAKRRIQLVAWACCQDGDRRFIAESLGPIACTHHAGQQNEPSPQPGMLPHATEHFARLAEEPNVAQRTVVADRGRHLKVTPTGVNGSGMLARVAADHVCQGRRHHAGAATPRLCLHPTLVRSDVEGAGLGPWRHHVHVGAVWGVGGAVTDGTRRRHQVHAVQCLSIRHPFDVVGRTRVEERGPRGPVHLGLKPIHLPLHRQRDAWQARGGALALVQAVDRPKDGVVAHQPFCHGPGQGAARAVAAKRAAAVRVSKVHQEVGVVARLDHNHPIRPHAVMPVADGLDLGGRPVRGKQAFLTSVDQDEVVARAFPFDEVKPHEAKVLRENPRLEALATIFGPCLNLRNPPHPQGSWRRTVSLGLPARCPTSTKNMPG